MTKIELYSNFAKNIEIERERLRFSQRKMAEALEISLSKYKVLITNPYEARVDIYLAHKILILTGKSVRELCNDDLPELKTIELLRELPEHRRKAIGSLIETEYYIAGAVEDKKKDAANVLADEKDIISCFVPTGNMVDGMLWDSQNIITVNIKDHRKIYNNNIDFAIKITSNHLHPVYIREDILLVSRQAPRDGDIGIFIYKDTRQIFIREFKQTNPCELRPVNGYGDIIYVDSSRKDDMDKWVKIGTVISVLR